LDEEDVVTAFGERKQCRVLEIDLVRLRLVERCDQLLHGKLAVGHSVRNGTLWPTAHGGHSSQTPC
jgi:hypothetical protein